MGYKEIMAIVNKDMAITFMTHLKTHWNGNPSLFTTSVNEALQKISIFEMVNSGTANAIVTRMERKSKIQL